MVKVVRSDFYLSNLDFFFIDSINLVDLICFIIEHASESIRLISNEQNEWKTKPAKTKPDLNFFYAIRKNNKKFPDKIQKLNFSHTNSNQPNAWPKAQPAKHTALPLARPGQAMLNGNNKNAQHRNINQNGFLPIQNCHYWSK